MSGYVEAHDDSDASWIDPTIEGKLNIAVSYRQGRPSRSLLGLQPVHVPSYTLI